MTTAETKLLFPGLAGFYASWRDIAYTAMRVIVGCILLMHGWLSDGASPKIRDVAQKLTAAISSGDAKAAAGLFSYDASYLDRALRVRILGQLAIAKYLSRVSATIPYGKGARLVHVVGSDQGGGYEWTNGEADLPCPA